MKSILFIGDVHLDSQTPISRLDNYRELTINKLKSLLQLAIDNKAIAVVFTGDFFDKYDVPISYLNEVTDVFNMYKKNNIDVYTIIGNHETPYNKLEYFKNTPLSLLAKSGVVKLIENTGINLGNVTLYGLNFTDNLKNIPVDNCENYSILIMHYALDNTVPGESINTDELINFDLVVAGHDHMPYDVVKKGKTTFLRPGSFTRRTKDSYNLKRNIIVYKLDLDSKEIMQLELPGVKPANLVFKSEVLNDLESYEAGSYNDLFKEDFFKNEESDIIAIIDSLGDLVTEEARKALKDYIKNNI